MRTKPSSKSTSRTKSKAKRHRPQEDAQDSSKSVPILEQKPILRVDPDEKTLELKPPPKKHQPRGLSILHEDRDIIVVNKISGLLTVSSEKVKDNTAYSLLTHYVQKGNPKSRNRIYIVHRLDRDTSGILVFAKTPQAKKILQDEWAEFQKIYYAVAHGKFDKKKGVLSSYLTENSIHKVFSVKDSEKGKLAKTSYKVLKESELFSLLEVQLLTGRKNQIRVHFSEKDHPLVGDKKYGNDDKEFRRLALHSASLIIRHPYQKEKMLFQTKFPEYFTSLLKAKPSKEEGRAEEKPSTHRGKRPSSPSRKKPTSRPRPPRKSKAKK